MYASDFPHWDFDEPEQTLRQLPEAWRENVRAGERAGLLPPTRARGRLSGWPSEKRACLWLTRRRKGPS